MSNPAIEEAFQRAGGRKKVIEALKAASLRGASKQSLSDWIRQGYVPADKAGKLEELSGVSRRDLCPQFDWGPAVPAKQSSEKART